MPRPPRMYAAADVQPRDAEQLLAAVLNIVNVEVAALEATVKKRRLMPNEIVELGRIARVVVSTVKELRHHDPDDVSSLSNEELAQKAAALAAKTKVPPETPTVAARPQPAAEPQWADPGPNEFDEPDPEPEQSRDHE
jgi:hypothetical protein